MARRTKYTSYRKKVLKQLTESEQKALGLMGESVRSKMVEKITDNGSVDTGLMRNSCDYVTEDKKVKTYRADRGEGHAEVSHKAKDYGATELSVVVGNAVNYALWVDQGTEKQQAKPFMKPAVRAAQPELKKIAEKTIKKGMK